MIFEIKLTNKRAKRATVTCTFILYLTLLKKQNIKVEKLCLILIVTYSALYILLSGEHYI